MAFTPQELDILKQVKEQGWTIDQARSVVLKFRQQQVQTPEATWETIEQQEIQVEDKRRPTIKQIGREALETTIPWQIMGATADIRKDVVSGLRGFGADIWRAIRGEKAPAPWEAGVQPWFIGRSIEKIRGAGEDIEAAKTAELLKKQWGWRTLAQATWIVWLTWSDIIWDLFITTLKTLVPEEAEEMVKQWLQSAMETKWWQAVAWELQEALEWYEFLKENDPEKARDYKAFFGWLQVAADVLWFWALKKAAVKTGKEIAKEAPKKIISEWVKPSKFKLPEVKIPEVPKPLREAAERIERWPVEFRWVPWKEPVIWPIKAPEIVKGVDITKSDDLISRGLKPSIVWKDTWPKIAAFNNKIREWVESVAKRKWLVWDWPDALRKTDAAKKEIWDTVKKDQSYVKTKTKWSEITKRIDDFKETREW